MAINDLPTPADASRPTLRSYREAASVLLKNEGLDRKPLEPRGGSKPRPASPCGSPPRFRCTNVTGRCRSRTPSPPHPREELKTPRSVSPGGTPASSAGKALRASLRRDEQGAPETPSPAAPAPRRVSWSPALVASVRTRPRTPREDIAGLFYSRADERRFRREAEEADDAYCAVEEDSLASLSSEDDEESLGGEDGPQGDGHQPLWSRGGTKDYAISKAVVVFGASTKTYGGGSCAAESALEAEALGSFAFDDAAFWNGQLTWS